MEDSQRLVDPDSQDVDFGIAEESVDFAQALDDFGHVSQIEDVVTCAGSGPETFGHILEQIQGGLSDGVRHGLDFLFEIHKLKGQNRLEYSFSLSVSRESEVQHLELGLKSFADFCSASIRGSHCGNKLDLHYIFEELPLLSVEPASIVEPLAKQF